MGRPLPEKGLRLFCLPPAGSGAGIFYPLMELECPELSICPLSLPGREGRAHEKIPHSIPELAELLARDLLPHIRPPYAILGYSMGSLLGYEMIHRWLEWGLAPPELFITLAARPPHRSFGERLSDLDQQAFRQALSQLGGLPKEILADEETMSLFEPLLRQDFQNCENYRVQNLKALPNPISAIVSDEDSLLEIKDVTAWKDCTSGSFQLTTLRGEPHILPPKILKDVIQFQIENTRA